MKHRTKIILKMMLSIGGSIQGINNEDRKELSDLIFEEHKKRDFDTIQRGAVMDFLYDYFVHSMTAIPELMRRVKETDPEADDFKEKLENLSDEYKTATEIFNRAQRISKSEEDFFPQQKDFVSFKLRYIKKWIDHVKNFPYTYEQEFEIFLNKEDMQQAIAEERYEDAADYKKKIEELASTTYSKISNK